LIAERHQLVDVHDDALLLVQRRECEGELRQPLHAQPLTRYTHLNDIDQVLVRWRAKGKMHEEPNGGLD
jgi:hypothetical protein